jgi:hypothetical protein
VIDREAAKWKNPPKNQSISGHLGEVLVPGIRNRKKARNWWSLIFRMKETTSTKSTK